MESLRARIPDAQMWYTTTMIVRKSSDPEVISGEYPLIEHSKEPMEMGFEQSLKDWLKTCSGGWDIVPDSWQIEFEREEDYVRYCFDWL
jgi:hypothetical protein